MKKKLLATGVAVALGALSGLASAAVTVNAGGVGQINVLPYYSVQEGNDTLISITNTDTTRGKAVKVRFRGAEWSDDVFDFQVFLSPGDMWTGAVTKEGTLAKMSTSDTSCTLPASINQQFVPIRLQAAAQATGTLEGYVEIITMADIPATGTGAGNLTANWAVTKDLYNATKHVANGAPACRTDATAQALLEGLTQDNVLTPAVAPQVNWMVPPTSALTSYATIINVPTSKAFTFPATALVEDAPVKQYFEQSNNALAFNTALTSDNIFAAIAANGGADVPMYQFDMPDLSTPTNAVDTLAVDQRNALATLLARGAVSTEYVTTDSLLASTDVVISQPLRRYFYEYTQNATTGFLTLANSAGVEAKYLVNGDVGTVYEPLQGANAAANRIPVGTPRFFDREENTFVGSSGIVISPTPPATIAPISLKGEVSVVSINNSGLPTGALNASITANDYTATGGYANGWTTLSTASQGTGGGNLPVIGFTAINLFNASAGSAGTNYGMVLPLK